MWINRNPERHESAVFGPVFFWEMLDVWVQLRDVESTSRRRVTVHQHCRPQTETTPGRIVRSGVALYRCLVISSKMRIARVRSASSSVDDRLPVGGHWGLA